ncbi:T-cell surface glycoprotein CD4 isoform X2 [Apodemus sylvaticus]|uniref:T-cell surface glycoprotein CD4 isoform X2 n=1 Tax=Apodemus sylvaticus TaxID=10129 RepID=UPI0022434C36|nr:T-cell surface glycoprotein CD4 isoform X2 [Apodemus sylvaticus]
MWRGISFRHSLLLLLQLLQLLAVIQGKTVVLGKEGETAELPCEGSSKKNAVFNWKLPGQKKILGRQNNILVKGLFGVHDRFDSRQSAWDKGSFPLIISKLRMEDSRTYICELENKKEEVELLVFKVIISPGTSLLQGQNLTLTLESKTENRLIECKHKGGKIVKGSKVLSMSNVRAQDSDFWNCTVTLNQKKHSFGMRLSVLGFQSTSFTAYKNEGEAAEFSFPLNIGEESLQGELKWRKAENPSVSESWISFSIKNKKVSVPKPPTNPKLQMAEMLPLSLKIPQVSFQLAGSGNLTLTLDKGTLHQEVNLVVMRVAQLHNNTLTCKVVGPTSPEMRLTLLKEGSQEATVFRKEKEVQVMAPDAGMWHCQLHEGDKVKIDSRIQVSSRGLDQTVFLAVVLGGAFGFLALIGLCILCCVRCRHQQRQAARMSQIKRLLSEKKTCQCPHRMQKGPNLI